MRVHIKKSLTCVAYTLLCSCAVGPDYVRPKVDAPLAFKEAKGWKVAEPKDELPRGKWWEMFEESDSPSEAKCYLDTELDELESQIDVSNQNLKRAEANFRQAQASVSQARAAFFPTVNGNYSDMRTNNPPTTNVFGFSAPGAIFNQYDAGLSLNWELDVWGRIKREVESKHASAGASEADVAAARLSAQAELATDYISLRYADEQKRLLELTVANDEKTLKLTKALYEIGISRRSDEAEAESRYQTSRAQAIDAGIERAQYEHAIAVLVGKAPADFSIPSVSYVPVAPNVPALVPSELLERRPDVASAERSVAAANAQIGVAQAAFFPTFSLSATGGYQSFAFEHFSQLFSDLQRVWSIGPSVSAPIFDAGLHSAQKAEAIAEYDQRVASYRQTTLTAFKEVEDALVNNRLLADEAVAKHAAAASSQVGADILLAQYKAGITRYLDVMTAENTQTNDQLSAIATDNKRVTQAVTLIKALGGGWNADTLEK